MNFFSSLRSRIMFLIIAAIIPLVILILIASSHWRKNEIQESLIDAKIIADLAAMEEKNIIDNTKTILVTLAQLSEVRHLDPKSCHSILSKLLRENPTYTNFGIVLSDGYLFTSAISSKNPINFSDHLFFQLAMKESDFSIGNVQVEHITHKSCVHFGYPIKDCVGHIIGVIYAAIDLEKHLPLNVEIQKYLPKGAMLLYVDRKGNPLYRLPQSNAEVNLPSLSSSLLNNILKSDTGIITASGQDGNQHFIISAAKESKFYDGAIHVILDIPQHSIFREINHYLFQSMIITIAVLGVSMLLAGMMGRYFIRHPINIILQATKRINDGDLSVRTGHSYGKNEFSQLATSFDAMAQSIQNREHRHIQLETSLQLERDKAQAYLNIAGTIFVLIRADQTVGMINTKGCEILEYEENEILGKNWFDSVIDRKDREYVKHIFALALKGDFTQAEHYHNPIRTKSGSKRWIAWHNAALYDEKNQIYGILSSGDDRTEFRHMLEELQTKESAISSSINAIALANLEGYLTFVNQAFLELWDYENPEDILGQDVLDFWHNKNDALQVVHALQQKGKWFGELVAKRRNGQLFWVQLSAHQINSSTGEAIGMMGSFVDITARKEAEKQIILKQQQLQDLAYELSIAEEKERKNIASTLHDRIGQALVFIKMKIDSLLKSEVSAEVNHVMQTISSVLEEVIDNTQTLTFELGSPTLYQIGLTAAIQEWLAEEIGKKYGMDTEYAGEQIGILDDSDIMGFLFNIVRELSINVVKHAKARKICINMCNDNNRLVLCVSDDGQGWNNPSFVKPENKKGGYGLYYIKERLDYLRGSLDIQSDPENGTQIKIELPIKDKNSTRRSL